MITQKALAADSENRAIEYRGCYLWRSNDGISTTIKYIDVNGKVARFKVLDRYYRGLLVENTKQSNSVLMTPATFNSNNVLITAAISGFESIGEDSDNPTIETYRSSKLINALKNDKTSKQNSDILYQYNNSSYSTGTYPNHGKNTKIYILRNNSNLFGGITWDIPNLYCLGIIILCVQCIDSLDTTTSKYLSYNRIYDYINAKGSPGYCISSSLRSTAVLFSMGHWGSISTALTDQRVNANAIPIKEI